jgi:hypothetical protein
MPPSIRLAAVALLLAAGCRGKGPGAEARPAPDVAASASASSTAPAPGAASTVAGPLTYEAMEAEHEQRCDWKRAPKREVFGDFDPESSRYEDVYIPSYHELKLESDWDNACGAKLLDEALRVALKGTPSLPPARPLDLHREQDEWRRWSDAFGDLQEAYRWSDLDGGNRAWGELEGLQGSTFHFPLQVERMLYLRALTARDAGVLAARAHALHAAGEHGEAMVATLGAKARALLPRGASKMPDARPSPYPILRSQLEDIVSLAAKVQAGAAALGTMSCGWKELADALGGKPACAREMTLYYLGVWGDLRVGLDPDDPR